MTHCIVMRSQTLMSRVYLAGPYSERLTLARYAFELLQDGHAVTSRWLMGTHPYGTLPSEAQNDLDDVQACDTLVLFSQGTSPGGRYVEFGYALARGKTCYVVGPQDNLFHYLAANVFAKWDDCRQHLFIMRWED